MQALSEALGQMVEAYNDNYATILAGFDLNDRHLIVQRMIMQDVADGRVMRWPPSRGAKMHAASMLEDGCSIADVSAELSWMIRDTPTMHAQPIFYEWYYQECTLLLQVVDLMKLIAAVTKEQDNGAGTQH